MRYLTVVLLISLLYGCGFKGPLYVPNQQSNTQKPKENPAKIPPIESQIP
jgi:predicted small lipoprotein YifL